MNAPRQRYEFGITREVAPEAWAVAAEMVALLEQVRPLNARLLKLMERCSGARPVPFPAVDLENVIRHLKK